MRILITAAEQEELDCAILALRKCKGWNDAHKADFMLTGIGATSAAYKITRQIYMAKAEGKPYDVALNIGIAGSYDMERFPLGSIGAIEAEHFGDLGFETFTGFQTLFDYKILEQETFPYRGGALLQRMTLERAESYGRQGVAEFLEKFVADIPKAVGVTVQTVSGDPHMVEMVHSIFSPHIESMEGAAFYYVCIWEHIPAVELRSISNEVGERDRSKWDVDAALAALESTMAKFFEKFNL